MRGAVVQGPGEVRVQTVPEPNPTDGQVLVQMICSAICGSDLHSVLDGVPALACPGRPGAPGHEGVGVVVESRAADRAEQQLVLTVPDRRSAGAFADFQALPSRFALPVPDGVAPELMVCAQQYGTVLYAMRRFWPWAGAQLAVVLGLGPAGLQFVSRLKEIGFATVIGSDPVSFRRQLAADLGCDLVIDPATTDPYEVVAAQSGGRGAELVVEASGRNAGRLSALGLVEERGRVGFFGLPEAHAPLVLPYAEVFERKPTIVISDGAQHEPDLRSFREAIDAIGRDQSVAARLVTHHYSLSQFETALHTAASREGVGKVVVHNGPSPLVTA
jgi:L-iditol 2-dehydrogenase